MSMKTSFEYSSSSSLLQSSLGREKRERELVLLLLESQDANGKEE
jgi:hypothetical protein